MIAYVYKPKRRVGGKVEIQRTYRGRYRLEGEFSVTDVTLDTPDKQVAQTKLRAIVSEKEREKAGLTAPASERKAVARSTLTHLTDFLADLKTLGRAKHYIGNVKSRAEKLIADCGFHKLGDIASDKFVSWRSQQKEFSPKTLNDYLSSFSTFMNWLAMQSRIASNPLAKVSKVDTRGRQKKRRAITQDELQRLLAVTTPERRLIYLTAIYTGLRSGELRQLVWADLHLDEERPYLLARASTTKNRKEAVIPLHPDLAAELRQRRKQDDGGAVLEVSIHMNRAFQKDLTLAKIEPMDALGRKLDFHALRKTFATRLAVKGVAQRLTQELMRHQDANLTAQNYTDANLLPTFAAVASLEWEGKAPTPDAHTDTHIDTQKAGARGHNGAQADTENSVASNAENSVNKGDCLVLAFPDLRSQMVRAAGFEPTTPTV